MNDRDSILFERSKLLIMTTLATADEPISFSELVEVTGLTRGNLSSHLKKLTEVRYVKIKKQFADNRPLTTVVITENGHLEFRKHIQGLKTLLERVKG